MKSSQRALGSQFYDPFLMKPGFLEGLTEKEWEEWIKLTTEPYHRKPVYNPMTLLKKVHFRFNIADNMFCV